MKEKVNQVTAIVVGSDSSSSLGVVRSLGEEGVEVHAVVTNKSISFIKHSKYLSKYWGVNENEEDIIRVLLKEYKNLDFKPVIIPTSDLAAKTIDHNINKLKGMFIVPNIDLKEGRIASLMNKSKMVYEAEKAGLIVPKTQIFYFDERSEQANLANYIFPCIVKPVDSVIGDKDYIKKCNTYNELISYLQTLKSKGTFASVVIQEYVGSKDEYMIDLMGVATVDDKILIPGSFKKIRQFSNLKQGTLNDGNCSLAMLTPEKHGLNLEQVAQFIKNTGFKGIFDIEFKIVEGQPVFIEINFRIGGTNYMYKSTGSNLPYLWYLSALNLKYDDFYKHITEYTLHMIEQRDIRNVLHGELSINKFVRDFLTADTRELFNKNDIKPFLMYFLGAPKKIYLNYFAKTTI